MYQKSTKRQLEDKLIKLTKIKEDIEKDPKNEHPESVKQMRAWKMFKALPYAEQSMRWAEWGKYYEQVKETPAYALFQAQREAAEAKQMNRVIELSREARQMRLNNDHITLPKPPFVDPWSLERGWVKSYLDCEKQIFLLRDELRAPDAEETKEVWSS